MATIINNNNSIKKTNNNNNKNNNFLDILASSHVLYACDETFYLFIYLVL